MTPSLTESATFRFVAQRLNHCDPHCNYYRRKNKNCKCKNNLLLVHWQLTWLRVWDHKWQSQKWFSLCTYCVYVYINLRIPEIQLISIIVSDPHTVHLIRK